jgi:hypothetical protein
VIAAKSTGLNTKTENEHITLIFKNFINFIPAIIYPLSFEMPASFDLQDSFPAEDPGLGRE